MNKSQIKELKKNLKEYAKEKKREIAIDTTNVNSWGCGYFQLFTDIPTELSDIAVNFHNIDLTPDTTYYSPVDSIDEDYYSTKYPATYKLSKSIHYLHIQKSFYDLVTNIFGDVTAEINASNLFSPVIFREKSKYSRKIVALVAPLMKGMGTGL